MRSFLFIGVVVGLTVISPPTDAQAYCRCECHAVPGGRMCRKICTYPQPRYMPAPQFDFSPGDNYTPAYGFVGPSMDPGALAALGLIVIVGALIFAGIAASRRDPIDSAMAEIDQATTSMRALSRDAEHTAHAIDTHIEERARESFQRGRVAAYKEWTGE